MSSISDRTDTIHRINRDSCFQYFGTHMSLLMLFTDSIVPVMRLHGLTGLAKRPSVKADLAIYNHMFGVSIRVGVALNIN